MKSIKEVLALNLKINRLRQDLTQEKLAEKAQISTHYLAMVELAKKFPSATMIDRLAVALKHRTPRIILYARRCRKSPRKHPPIYHRSFIKIGCQSLFSCSCFSCGSW